MDAMTMLKRVEWLGYNTQDSERACPSCGAWAYQHGKEKPLHSFACALADIIGAECEGDKEFEAYKEMLRAQERKSREG